MKHPIMSRVGILTLVILAAAIGVSLLVMCRDSGSVSVPEGRVVPIAESAAMTHREVSDSNQTSANPERSFDCIPMTMIGQSPDAYRVDEWYRSWGAPTSFNIELSSRPYAHYQRNDLQELSRNGDAEATHELGRSLVWRAFRDGERMPDYETLWEIGGDRFPYDDHVDMNNLARGREYMYRAAVEGRIYALIDISLSYAHQVAVERNNGELDNERELVLRMEAFAYGEAVEKLVTGMPPSFFQAKIPEEEERAAAKLSSLIERFTLDRANEGLDASNLPSVSDDLFDALNLCLK